MLGRRVGSVGVRARSIVLVGWRQMRLTGKRRLWRARGGVTADAGSKLPTGAAAAGRKR